ncbi:helix-turn-helix domain-containing protein [Tumebacillus permanentifrigoris]|uniref:Helix-turn-helix protein n=1 Tax=Tumebacillus permanentifrigoris TaxID=378543 RepID=A0A316D2H1_9BACL|nr:helix-turn-helix transcriptional regulator [Tumebacillus permanentifrigoris]PWK05086.1 helix-turn-helix protein [Tumebacillus permanentifrigoris]
MSSVVNFGPTIKKIRNSLGETQRQFADRFGKVQSIVADWESGKKRPKHEDVLKIAELGNIDVSELYGSELEQETSVPDHFGEQEKASLSTLKRIRNQIAKGIVTDIPKERIPFVVDALDKEIRAIEDSTDEEK